MAEEIKKEEIQEIDATATEAVQEPIEESIEMNEDDVMPQPKVKEYQKYIRVKPKFKEMMENTLGTLGYNQNIGTPDTQIQVNKLFKIIEDHGEKMGINDMNQFIVLMSLAPWRVIHEFMAMIEKPELQAELWEIYEA